MDLQNFSTLCVLLLCLSIFYISLASVVLCTFCITHVFLFLRQFLPLPLVLVSTRFITLFILYFVTPFHHHSATRNLCYVKNLNHYFHCMNVQYATKMIHFTLSVRYGVFAIGKRTCISMLMEIPVMIAVSFHTKH